MKEINVEEIMAGIRQEIKDKGYTPEMLSFRDENASYVTVRDFDFEEFMYTVGRIGMTKDVPWKQENQGSGFKSFVKKVVQKLAGPILSPMSEKQNMYNRQVTEAFEMLLGYLQEQQKQQEQK